MEFRCVELGLGHTLFIAPVHGTSTVNHRLFAEMLGIEYFSRYFPYFFRREASKLLRRGKAMVKISILSADGPKLC
jgi:hypothetical protein